MKKRFFKRMLAVILTVCIAFSTFTIFVSAAGVWSTGAKNFGVNKLYSTGLLVAGKALTSIAQATGCEEFEKIASFVNVWVCGGNPTTQTLAEIEELCQEILAEVKKIEQKQDSYATYFSTQQAQDKYDELVKEMNSAWKRDVEDIISKEGINVALLDYFEYEDMTEVSSSDTNRNIGYLTAAYCYKNNTPDKYGKYYSFEDVQDLREDLFYDFCSIYGSMPSDANTVKEKADILFSDTGVDVKFQTAIRNLSNAINTEDSYSDMCAQVAYQSMPNLSDQYEYVTTGMNKQFMQVIIVEMLYQEYLSMRGEYLEKCHPEDTSMWNSYRKDGIEKLEEYNEELLGIMENRISKPLKLDTNITLSVDKYVRPEDVTDITLKNTEYRSRRDGYDYSWVSYESPNMTDAQYTKEYMDFIEIAIPTSTGVELFYLFDGDAETLKTKNLVVKFDGTAGVDWYGATCDSYNFRHCTYSDGINNFSNPVDPSGDAVLFRTDSFALYGSTPYSYLSQYFDYVPQDKGLYRMYADSDIDYEADGWLTDDHTIYYALDMKDSYVGFDTSLNLVEKVDAKVVYDSGYSRSGYDKAAYDSYFNVILTQDSDEIKHKLSYSETGDGNVDMYVTKSDGTKVSSGTTLTSGEDLTLWIKTTDANSVLKSLSMSKYNDYQNPTTPTSTNTLLEGDDFYSLKLDEATGYLKLDFTMPYSDTKLELTTDKGYIITTDDSKITIKSYDNLFSQNETVNVSYDGKVDYLYYVLNGKTVSVSMSYDEDTEYSNGSFSMPASDISIYNLTSLDKDDNGNFIIKTYDDLYTMAYLVNSGNSEYVNGSYALVNDIDCSGRNDWIPIGHTALYYESNPTTDGWGFKGTFDGNGHVIKNLSVTGSSAEDLSYGIFGTVSGTVKNLGVENFTYKGAGKDSRVGAIAGQVLEGGTITDCYVKTGDINTQINTTNGVAGGISGANYGGTIQNCYTYDLNIKAGRAGGIVGDNYGDANNADGTDRPGTIKNCYTSSEAICNRGTATDSLSKLTINTFMSGEITYRLNNGVTDGTQIWYQNVDTAQKDDVFPMYSGGTVYYGYLYCTSTDKIYTNQEISDGYLHKYNENGFCELCGKYEPAPLNEDGFYEISNAGQLYWFASLVNGDKTNADFSYQNTDANAILMNDIIVNSQEITSATNSIDVRNWKTMCPGRFSGYTGTFDGQGHVVSGLYHNSNDSYVGFFGYLSDGAVVKNLGIVNSYFHGGEYSVGSICSDIYGGTIENCYSTAGVSGNMTSTSAVGGLVGVASASSVIKNSYFAGTIDDKSDYIGSICGTLWTNSVIENCYYNGNRDCFKIHSTAKSDAEKKTAEQFASGEITYLLNNGVTDGTQAWYQNIIGENTDAYPVLDNTHSTVYKSEAGYTNGLLIGDINSDGVINEDDLLLLGNYLVRKDVLTLEEVTLGDVNGDGKTDPEDLLLMNSYVNKEEGADYGNVGKYGINSKPSDALLVGDVNFDGIVDTQDADLLSQFNVEMITLTDEQLRAGDIDLDGHISSKDTSEINKYLAIISNNMTYTGNIGKYSYKGFDMNISSGNPSETPTEPSTVPVPDNSDANSSTSDNTSSEKTDNNAIQTGNPVTCIVLLIVMISGLVLMFTYRRYKNR